MVSIAILLLGATEAHADWTESWSGSRWFVEMEELTPVPVELSAEENYSFRTRMVQLGAILSCGTAAPMGKSAIELDCTFEDVRVRAIPRGDQGPEPQDDAVLQDMVKRLKAATVRLGLADDGRLLSVDLPTVRATTRRESESREMMRGLVSDLVSPFHLKRADAWNAGWVEKNTELLRAPSQPQSMGTSRVEHTVSVIDGATIVQSNGEGTFTAPYVPWQFSADGKVPHTVGKPGSVSKGSSGMGGLSPVSATRSDEGLSGGAGRPSATTPADLIFNGQLTSVAVLSTEGWPLERVWAMHAGPTASSVGNMQGTSVWYNGRLRRLDAGDVPDLGATAIVAPLGATVEGLAPWKPIETF